MDWGEERDVDRLLAEPAGAPLRYYRRVSRAMVGWRGGSGVEPGDLERDPHASCCAGAIVCARQRRPGSRRVHLAMVVACILTLRPWFL